LRASGFRQGKRYLADRTLQAAPDARRCRPACRPARPKPRRLPSAKQKSHGPISRPWASVSGTNEPFDVKRSDPNEFSLSGGESGRRNHIRKLLLAINPRRCHSGRAQRETMMCNCHIGESRDDVAINRGGSMRTGSLTRISARRSLRGLPKKSTLSASFGRFSPLGP